MRDGLHLRGKVWHFGWKGPDGRRREISTRSREFQKARTIRAARLRELDAGLFGEGDARMLFAQAACQWLEHANLSNPARNTKRFRQTKLNSLLKFFGRLRLREITPARILHFQAQRNRSAAAATNNAEFCLLRAILQRFGTWTEAHGRLCRPLRVRQEMKRRALLQEELNRLFGLAGGRRSWRALAYALELGLHTGLRSAEIRGLRLRDIALDAQPHPRLAIRRTNTKTAAGERLVMLDFPATEAIKALLIIARGRGARHPNHFLFPRRLEHGRSWDPTQQQTGWGSAWRSLRQAADLAEIRFHDLRHTYITTGAEAGVPLDVMMRQVGHVAAAQTRHYIQIRDAALGEAVEAIERRLKAQRHESGTAPRQNAESG